MTTIRLFDRRFRLTVAGVAIDGLRVAFDVTRTLRATPNEAQIRVYGLSRSTEALIVQSADVALSAGYADGTSGIFRGAVRYAQPIHEEAERGVSIFARDGAAAWRATSALSLAAGGSVLAIVSRLATDAGLTLPRASTAVLAAAGRVRGSAVAVGSTWRRIDDVLTSAGLSWSIQDGAIQILAPGQTLQGDSALLTPATGLIGSPSRKVDAGKETISARSLLRGDIVPGARVEVRSDGFAAVVRAVKVRHSGDTHGQDWITEIEGRSVA
jgi:hypothetical protein